MTNFEMLALWGLICIFGGILLVHKELGNILKSLRSIDHNIDRVADHTNRMV